VRCATLRVKALLTSSQLQENKVKTEQSSERGFTLVELVFAIAAVLLLVGVVTDFTFRDPVPVIQVVRSGSKRIAFLG